MIGVIARPVVVSYGCQFPVGRDASRGRAFRRWRDAALPGWTPGDASSRHPSHSYRTRSVRPRRPRLTYPEPWIPWLARTPHAFAPTHGPTARLRGRLAWGHFCAAGGCGDPQSNAPTDSAWVVNRVNDRWRLVRKAESGGTNRG